MCVSQAPGGATSFGLRGSLTVASSKSSVSNVAAEFGKACRMHGVHCAGRHPTGEDVGRLGDRLERLMRDRLGREASNVWSRDHVAALLQELGPMDRGVVVLRYWGGLTCAEIAVAALAKAVLRRRLSGKPARQVSHTVIRLAQI